MVKALADRQPETPERDVVGHIRSADGAEEDRIKALQLRHSVLRHHTPVGFVVLGAPVEVLDAKLEVAAALLQCFERLETSSDDFRADPVGRNGGNLVFAHRHVPVLAVLHRGPISCAIERRGHGRGSGDLKHPNLRPAEAGCGVCAWTEYPAVSRP